MNAFCLVSNISILPVFLTRTSPLIQKINIVSKMVAMREGEIYIVTGKGRHKRKIRDIVSRNNLMKMFKSITLINI